MTPRYTMTLRDTVLGKESTIGMDGLDGFLDPNELGPLQKTKSIRTPVAWFIDTFKRLMEEEDGRI